MELYQVQKPARYIGHEWNSLQNKKKEYTFALAFPDAYEIAQSGLGMKILYDIINSHTHFHCERVFAPLPDMETFIRERNIPLFSLESKNSLREFDIIGFTLQYEMTYTNILNMLELSGIPLKSSERDANYPLIIAGGPCAYNPEPLCDFFDLFVIGDGEEVVVEILDAYSSFKAGGGESREDLLLKLSQISGVYVPSFYNVEYGEKSEVKGITAVCNDVPAKINKRQVQNLDAASFPTRPVVPYIQSVHDRVMLEIFRGCTRGCRFCKAGFIYRPVRERAVDTLVEQASKSISSAGYDELSLLSLSCSDYSRIEDLLKKLIADFAGDGITISLPSLRMDNFSLKLADLTKTPRKAGLTFAPEAGSQRMRDVINKNLTEEQIFGTLLQAERMGWKMVKLYFMIGLPTETEDDVLAIADLIRQILKRTRFKLNVSISHFVPQPFTPFQWEPMENVESLKKKAYLLKDSLRNRRVQINYHEPATSLMEGVFSRGDRRLGKVIELAFRKGARFDGWSDYFNYSLWQEAFREAEVSPEDYLRRREESEILPWEHIYPELSKDFLMKEFMKASLETTTDDCRENCTGCGVCSDKVSHAFAGAAPVVLGKSESVSGINERAQRIRIRLSRGGVLKWISHLDMQRTLERALRRSGIPMSYTEGFHPRPRLSFAIPLPLGYTSDADWMDIFLHREMSPEQVKQALQDSLPEGLNVLEAKEVPLSDKTLTSDTIKITYGIELPTSEDHAKDYQVILEDFPGFGEISIVRKNKTFDARQLITRLEPEITRDRCQVYLDVLLKPSGSVKPDEIIKVLLGNEIASKCSYHRSEILIESDNGWILP